MKRLLCSSVLMLSLTAFSANAEDIFDSLDECKYLCNHQCERLVKKLDRALQDIDESCFDNDQPNYPPYNPPHNPYGPQVELFKSDSCNGSFITEVSSTTNCSMMARSINAPVWAIKVNGRCMNIADTSFLSACEAFKNYSPEFVHYYKSDSCNGDLVAVVDERGFDCRNLGRYITSQVWAIRVGGQCINTLDTSFSSACYAFSDFSRKQIVFYKSDSCNSDAVAAVDTRTNCEELDRYVTGAVWGIKVNGRCMNVDDTSVKEACIRYKNLR